MNRDARLLSLLPDIASVETPDSVVVMRLDPSRCEPLHISGSGQLVWNLLRAAPRTLAETITACCELAQMEASSISDDVARFVAQLDEAGLLAND